MPYVVPTTSTGYAASVSNDEGSNRGAARNYDEFVQNRRILKLWEWKENDGRDPPTLGPIDSWTTGLSNREGLLSLGIDSTRWPLVKAVLCVSMGKQHFCCS